MSCLDPILTNLEKLTGRGGNLRNGHKFYSKYKKDDDNEEDEEQIQLSTQSAHQRFTVNNRE